MEASDYGKKVRVAPAEERHLEGITEIYNHAILNTTSTFDSSPKSVEEQRAWLNEHDEKHPILVAILDGTVIGWGSLSPHSDRRCYDSTVEDSVYVREERRGKGIGRLILQRLLLAARKAGHHAVIARIDAGNETSLALHRKMGFEGVGRLREVGFKFGRWLDIVVMELLL